MVHFWKPISSIALLATCIPPILSQGGSHDNVNENHTSSVKTTSGPIVGHAAQRNPAVSEYLGIPYAAAPVGNLRFAAPVAYKSNGSAIQADAYVRYQPLNDILL